MKLAVNKISNEKVAIKIYNKIDLSDPVKMKNVRREINILKKLQHPSIILLK